MADTTTTVIEQPKPQTQTPPPEKPPKETTKDAPATDVSLDAAMQVFGDTLTYGLGKKKKVSTQNVGENTDGVPDSKAGKAGASQDEQTDDKRVEVETTSKPTEETVHKSKPKPKPVKRQELDETKLAEIAAEAGGRAASDAISRIEASKTKVDKPVAETFRPPPEYNEQYETFKVMAKSKPEKYGDLPDDFKRFVAEENDYIKSWKQEHPGEQWDGEAEDHNTFYERATPKYDEKDFRKAEFAAELDDAKKEIRKQVMEEVEPKLKKLDEVERNETLRGLQPIVESAERIAMGAILKAVDPAYEKFVEPNELAKLKDEDPVAFDIAIEVARDALPFISEVTKLWKSKGTIKAEENNGLHRYINQYADKMSELIKALPSDDQLRDGKQFASWSEFSSMTTAQQARHWILTDDDLIQRKLLDAQEIAAERVTAENKKLTSWAKRKGLSNGTAHETPPKADKPEPAKALPAKETNGSPAIGTRTQVGPGASPAPSSTPVHMDSFAALFNGRSL